MKQIVLILTIFLFSFGTNGQVEGQNFDISQKKKYPFGFSQGDFFVEGTIQLVSTKDNNSLYKKTQMAIRPVGGYFITDEIAVGVGFQYGKMREETANTIVDKNSSFLFGVFGRYYFLDNLGERFQPFATLGVQFGSGKQGLADSQYSRFVLNIGAGMHYFLSDNVALIFYLSDLVSYTSFKWKDFKSTSDFIINLNVFDNFFTHAHFGLSFRI